MSLCSQTLCQIAMGVRPEFPIKGVTFVMGNDLSWGKVLVTPDVTLVSVRQSPDAFAQVDEKSKSETDEAFVTAGALSSAEVAPPSVSLVLVSQHLCRQRSSYGLTEPVLSTPRYDLPFKLAVNTSDIGVSAVLLQEDLDGVEHPISYFSKLNCHQKWHSMVEKEALALVMAFERFKVYISSSSVPVIIYTDHNPIVFLDGICNKNRCLMSWSLCVQVSSVVVRHIRGRDNTVADALSHM